MNNEQLVLAVKASPPVTVLGVTVGGITLPDWAAIAALIYTILLTGDWCWKKWAKRQSKTRRYEDK